MDDGLGRRIFISMAAGGIAGLSSRRSPPDREATPPSEVLSVTAPTDTGAEGQLRYVDVDVSPRSVARREPVAITVTIENTGSQPRTTTLRLEIGDTPSRSRTETVPGGETAAVTFEIEPETVGRRVVHVGDTTTAFDVLETIVVVEIDRAQLSYWERLLFTCLQGIANRDSPQVFLRFFDTDDRWIDWYRDRSDRVIRRLSDPWELFDYSWPVEGYVVVDRWVADTANVAATYAATEQLLPVTERLLDRDALPDLDVRMDLRGRFREMDRAERYEWLLEQRWPASNSGLLCKLGVPGKVGIDISEYTSDARTLYVRFEDSDRSDGFGANLSSLRVVDGAGTRTEIVTGSSDESQYLVDSNGSWLDDSGNRIADRNQHWVYELPDVRGATRLELYITNQYLVKIATRPGGPYDVVARSSSKPDRFRNRTNMIRDFVVARNGLFVDLSSDPEHGTERALFGRTLDRMDPPGYVTGWPPGRGAEHHHVQQTSTRGRLVVPSANAPNFSVHQHVGDRETFTQPSKGSPGETPVADELVYVTFVMSDGDALMALAQFQFGNWLLDGRGEVPIGWELQPLLADIAPGMVEYYYETATDRDTFVGSASGIGYTFPDAMSSRQLGQHLRATRPYLERTDLTALTVLHDRPVPDQVARQYADELGDHLTGIVEGYWDRGGTERLIEGLPWLPTELPDEGRFSVDDIVADLREIAAGTSERPLFVPVHVPVTRGITTDDVVAIVRRLNPDVFGVVSPDELFSAYTEHRTG